MGEARQSGIEPVGDLQWGTHLCQFYQSADDLLRILVPYFKAGLAANESCMWVTSAPLSVEDARRALAEVVPDVDRALSRGQLEILPHDEWYLQGGSFDMDRVLAGWVERERRALSRGFAGLRITGNTAWLESTAQWRQFAEYERTINNVMVQYNMVAVCTYCLDKCGATEVMDVMANHQFALVKREDGWQVVESSERKRVAEALRQSEAKYRLLFENLSDGFAYHRVVYEAGRPVDYVFLEVNAAFERMTGLRRDDIIGKRVTEVLPGIERGDFDWIGTYGRVATTGEPVRFEQHAKPIDRWYSVSAYSPARETFAVTFEDITSRKQAQDERERLLGRVQKQAVELEKMLEQRDDMVRAISHDLRTPLTVIATQAQSIQRRPELTDRLPGRVDAILRGCERLDSMIEDLVTLARLESGQLKIEAAPVELGSFAQELKGRLAGALPADRVTLAIPEGLAAVMADPGRLERVLTNLLSNGLKYSPADRPVELAAEARDGVVRIAVSDAGQGIAAEDRAHVFERFYRAKGARSADGLGLGLYITRMLVEAQGGRIWIDDAASGCRMIVELPAARS